MPFDKDPLEDEDEDNETLQTARTSNSEAPPLIYSSGTGSFSYRRSNTPVIQNTDAKDVDRSYDVSPTREPQQPASLSVQRTPIIQNHNRDETWVANNLTKQEQETISDAVASGGYDDTSNSIYELFQRQSIGSDDHQTSLLNSGNGAAGGYSTFSGSHRTSTDNNVGMNGYSRLPYLKAISEKEESSAKSVDTSKQSDNFFESDQASWIQTMKQKLGAVATDICDPKQLNATIIGALLFSLYQLVFCFAEASAITRPSHSSSTASALLAPMALMACVGSLLTAPFLITVLGGDYPALYPCLDLFMAPYLGKMASDIDEVLVRLRGDDSVDDTAAFIATFVALNAFGMMLSAFFCLLAARVKLANLASFLPYPVLAGFFSSVGISVWMCAFKVDTGQTIQSVIGSGDVTLLLTKLGRNLPSFVAGVALYLLGPKNPAYLIGIILGTVVLAYATMLVTDTSLQEAQELGFFWKKEEVMMSQDGESFESSWGFYGPPRPFGLWVPSVFGKICWPAFMNGVSDVVAMSVIYLLRCSLHAAALKKNLANLLANNDTKEAHLLSSATSESDMTKSSTGVLFHAPKTSLIEDQIEAVNAYTSEYSLSHDTTKPKRKPKSVLEVLVFYAQGLFGIALTGGFAVLPAIALGGIFSKLGAKSRLPQFTSMFLLLGCYLSDFALVAYIPKFSFSSLLVLAAIDLVDSWFVQSYQKTARAYEWCVVPFIVVSSLTVGMLASVGLGVGASTFLFVSSFYQAGVVKFIANGLTIRSTIERGWEDNEWLDQNADLIQILVLQNYLYFGNATSCLNYISSMFDDDGVMESDVELPPIPKFVILDMSIVTGIDTSAVDVLAEISALCKGHKCKLLLSGLPRTVRPALITCGLKPSRKNSHLSFTEDLEASLGKAEDALLKFIAHNEEKLTKVGEQLRHQRHVSMVDHGLRHALKKIDEQHSVHFAKQLQALEKYTTPRDLEAGETLNEPGCESLSRGLYFVESGLLKCEHDASSTLTRGRQRSAQLNATPYMRRSGDSLSELRARSKTVGRHTAMLKGAAAGGSLIAQYHHTFRLARVGEGHVIGTISEFTGQEILGHYTSMTPCRVHHLPFETIEELEETNPVLIMQLYKMVSHLMARRQEMTIGQLSTLRSIMSASAPTKPISRRSMAAVNKAMKFH
jgi:MFS superfamily sulfate permease-like transporter